MKEAMLAASGGGYAYFNHEVTAGIEITYDPTLISAPQLWWRPQFQQINLDLFCQEPKLAPGGTLAFAYTYRALSAPPQ
jgi:hypothetical protein